MKYLSLFIVFVFAGALLICPASADTVEISGVWRFNDTVTITASDTIYEHVYFTYELNGESHSGRVIETKYGTGGTLSFVRFWDDPEDPFDGAFIAYSDDRWLANPEIDFGDEPQPVSLSFMDWMTANAVPLSTPSVVGSWTAVFSLIIPFFTAIFGLLIPIFYANGALTLLGILALCSLAVSVIILVFYIITNSTKWR